MTTVGYGDMYPTTAVGKAIGFCCMLSGVLVLSMPISIVGTFFSLEYERFQRKEQREQLKRKQLKRKHLTKSSIGQKKLDVIAKLAASQKRAHFTETEQREMAAYQKARNRAAEIVEEIAIRTQASLSAGLASQEAIRQLQAEASSILECTNSTKPLSGELREAAVISSIEFALPLLRQIERRGGLSGSISAAHLQYLQKQLIQLGTECFRCTELERQQNRNKQASSMLTQLKLPVSSAPQQELAIKDITTPSSTNPTVTTPTRSSGRMHDSSSNKVVPL